MTKKPAAAAEPKKPETAEANKPDADAAAAAEKKEAASAEAKPADAASEAKLVFSGGELALVIQVREFVRKAGCPLRKTMARRAVLSVTPKPDGARGRELRVAAADAAARATIVVSAVQMLYLGADILLLPPSGS